MTAPKPDPASPHRARPGRAPLRCAARPPRPAWRAPLARKSSPQPFENVESAPESAPSAEAFGQDDGARGEDKAPVGREPDEPLSASERPAARSEAQVAPRSGRRPGSEANLRATPKPPVSSKPRARADGRGAQREGARLAHPGGGTPPTLVTPARQIPCKPLKPWNPRPTTVPPRARRPRARRPSIRLTRPRSGPACADTACSSMASRRVERAARCRRTVGRRAGRPPRSVRPLSGIGSREGVA